MTKPLVSIIIRTCGRPQVLERALLSIREQDYPNIETVIVEDGENISEAFISENYADLNICYRATGEKRGRCVVGNLGLELASGEYYNFLDDDDYFLPSHVSTLVDKLEGTECRAAYTISEEHQIRKNKDKNSTFKVKRKLIRYKQPFNRLLLCYMNYIPIQSIMFHRTLFETCGGFDENLDVLEDWDLWLRYSFESDFEFEPVVTSVYHTPYMGKGKRKREVDMHKASDMILQKYTERQTSFDVRQVNEEMDYILNVFNKKGILFYMQKVRNFLLYRDI